MIKKGLLFFCCMVVFVGAQAQSAQELADTYADLSYFNTPMALSMKKGFKKRHIEKIKNTQLRETARLLLAGQYDSAYRMAAYPAYLTPGTLGRALMIGDGYSKYENMTGVYLPIGKQLVLVDRIAPGREVSLVIPNWNRHAPAGTDPDKDPAGWGIESQQFKLHNGVNIIDVEKFDGLAYIAYFSDTPESENPIQIHFAAASVNGYFDSAKDDDAAWDRLIDHAVYPIIDARGKHIQMAYPAADCKKYAYGKGVKLIQNYDSLISLQYQLLGLVKYHKVPKNHILARVNYNYYMFRDGDGVAYMGTEPGNAMPLVVDPARVVMGDPCWGFSHEVGHVHQLRPYFNWGGLGEVSNNLFSLYGTTSFGNKSRLSEQQSYQKARQRIIDKKISYLQDPDLFDKLVPFWQLQLYFTRIGNDADFYPRLFEAFRRQGATSRPAGRRVRRAEGWGDRGNEPAQNQLNFVKTACQVGKVDLTEFFDAYGFFYVGSFEYEDYGKYTYQMTQQMVEACKAEIRAMNLPKPKTDVSMLEDAL